jgi:hypothetical protein
MKHLEHFGVILIVNQTFMWFQLLFLASIMLIPFWNTYIEQFPENVAISISNGSVIISWDEVLGASSYNIYASSDYKPVTWNNPIDSVEETNWAGLLDDNRYKYFMIKASTDVVPEVRGKSKNMKHRISKK